MSTSFLCHVRCCHALRKRESKDLIRRSKETILFESYENIPLPSFTQKAIRKILKNPNVTRKIRSARNRTKTAAQIEWLPNENNLLFSGAL